MTFAGIVILSVILSSAAKDKKETNDLIVGLVFMAWSLGTLLALILILTKIIALIFGI